ncbi:type II toxin-antitoxin system PemK/MazF family toxin [Desulfonatronum thioautotrophicum]|uniref:type II toxin-antitoxin system PemK/MazF family toxin n=1 Tax=Desulfonatronum thioautotrophicum TaxID=617001 RepID=UPI001FC954F0|nr:type II toxin-antitoxin system PemK/MazF family toxin [Desulfonatronum thioautotrophicum]
MYVPDRGHVVWLHFNPQAGHEQAGHLPALVLSPATYNGKTGLALFCPITNQVKGSADAQRADQAGQGVDRNARPGQGLDCPGGGGFIRRLGGYVYFTRHDTRKIFFLNCPRAKART